METAHRLGMRTTATMMFGHVETLEERIDHLLHLRDLQDRTGGFTAFIAWTFQPQNTAIGGDELTSFQYLRTLAVARVMLDNFPNVQASWVTQGGKIGQISLRFGANDFGSLMIEENVVSAAGAHFRLTEAEIARDIQDAGFVPEAPDHALRDRGRSVLLVRDASRGRGRASEPRGYLRLSRAFFAVSACGRARGQLDRPSGSRPCSRPSSHGRGRPGRAGSSRPRSFGVGGDRAS